MSKYVDKVLADVKAKNPNEPEFIQAVDEVLTTLDPVLKSNPQYESNAILERMVEPERVIIFRVPWVDDKGNVQVNRAAKRQEIGVPEDAFLVLSVGELNDNKNHQVVINAIAKLQNPRVHYAIAGVGDKKEELTRLAHSLGVSEQLHLLGFRKDIPQLNCSADVFCFPSIREGLGLAAVEALACGVPVIAAENRGTRSFIKNGENGFMCPHNTADEFVAALSELINDSQARTVMASSCAATVTKFSVANVLARMHDVYGLDEQ